MNHRDIVLDVLNNLNQSPNAKTLSSVKRDLWHLTNKVLRKTKGIKDVFEQKINKLMNSLLMPEDFFLAEEVQFFTLSQNKYYCKEISYEKFMNWNPLTVGSTESFNELVESPDTPQQLITDLDTAELSGLIAYTWQDEVDMQKLLWKPSVDGIVKVYYCVTPFEDVNLDATPNLHFSFYDMLINGCTARGLLRLIKSATTEVELLGLQTAYKYYKEEFDNELDEYAAYVEKRSSTPIISGFNFLNDKDMLVG